MPTLAEILEIMRKPIEYATREQFAHFKKVQALDSFLNSQITAALKSTKSVPQRYEIEGLQTLLKDYQRFSEQDRKLCLLRARDMLESLIQKLPGTPENAPRSMTAGSAPEDIKRNVRHDPQAPRPTLEHATCSVQRDSFDWSAQVQYVKGVGPQRAKLLEKVGIKTVEDTLFFLPRRYEDRGNLKPISQLVSGEIQTVSGQVVAVDLLITPRRGMRILELALQDETGTLYAKWFNQPYLKKIFKKGQRLVLSGKLTTNRYYGHALEMENPNYEIMDAEDQDFLNSGRIVPIYPETKGFSSRPIRQLINRLLEQYASVIPEILPEAIRKAHGLLPLSQALQTVHFPPPGSNLGRFNQGNSDAHRRLIFDEFFLLQLGLALKKKGVQEEEKGIHFEIGASRIKRFIEQLPFQLTAAQKRVMDEIQKDMASIHPMNRLIQGDVGSGKTVVALFAMFIAVENGYQAALMVPTEILAEQHYLTLRPFLDRLEIPCALLTSGHSRLEKRKTYEAMETGSASILIGTHALLQDKVRFLRLGLAVVDEQHKFGVLQRAALTRKGYHPDVLIMTATPIPRTLALSVYGDLNLSILDEMPPEEDPSSQKFLMNLKVKPFIVWLRKNCRWAIKCM